MTGAEFKAIRLKAGLSQAALSLRLGVSHGRISNWELNYRPIPAEYADKMVTPIVENWPTEQEVGEVLK